VAHRQLGRARGDVAVPVLRPDPRAMSSIPRRARSAALVLAAVGATPHGVEAQAPAHLRTLTIPPATVGTCMPASVARNAAGSAAAGTARSPGRRLLMKTRNPGGERDVTLQVDMRGRPTGLSDRTFVMTGTSGSVTDAVVATFDSTGGIRGLRTHQELKLPADVATRPDPAARRARMQEATTQQTTQPLDASTERQVRALAAWMRDRCAAS
jgi:hypothetical protein